MRRAAAPLSATRPIRRGHRPIRTNQVYLMVVAPAALKSSSPPSPDLGQGQARAPRGDPRKIAPDLELPELRTGAYTFSWLHRRPLGAIFSPEIFAPPGTKGRWPETTDSPLVTPPFQSRATRRKSDSFKRVKRTNFPHPKFTVLCRGIRAGTIPSVGPRGAGTRLRFTGAIPISLPEQPALWNTGMDRVCVFSVPCPRDRQA